MAEGKTCNSINVDRKLELKEIPIDVSKKQLTIVDKYFRFTFPS